MPRVLAIEPTLSVTQTLSSNYRLTAVDPAYDAVTRLAAGISLRGQTGLARGYLDYTLSGLLHAHHSEQDTHQNALRAAVTSTLVEGRVVLDGNASISQSAVSAFGAQPSNGLNTANTTEVRTIQLAPTFKGPLGPDLRYTGTLGYSATDASRSDSGDSSTGTAALHIEPASVGRLGWSVDASHLTSDYKVGRTTEDDRLFGALQWRLNDLDLQLSANAGSEWTNLSSLNRERHSTWGVGAVWAPSPRTRLAADWENRFFGKSHSLSLEHRTPLTVWQLSDSRSLNTGGGGSGLGRGTVYDLLFAQLASVEPDAIKRAALVNTFLRDNGIDPATGLDPSFLRSSATVQDRQALSVALRGVRSTAVLLLSRTQTRRVQSALNLGDDLDNGDDVTTRQVSIDLSHRLTPMSSLSLVLSRQASSSRLGSQSSRQRQAGLQYTVRLAADASLILGGRRALYGSVTGPYDETALFATYGIRF